MSSDRQNRSAVRNGRRGRGTRKRCNRKSRAKRHTAKARLRASHGLEKLTMEALASAPDHETWGSGTIQDKTTLLSDFA